METNFVGLTVKVISRSLVECNHPFLVGRIVDLDHNGCWLDHLRVDCLIDGKILRDRPAKSGLETCQNT